MCNRRTVFRLRLQLRSSHFVVNFCNVFNPESISRFPRKTPSRTTFAPPSFPPPENSLKKNSSGGLFRFSRSSDKLVLLRKDFLFCPECIRLNPRLQKVFRRRNPAEKPERLSNRSPKTSISTVLWDKTKKTKVLTFTKSQNHCNRMNQNRETPARVPNPEPRNADKISKYLWQKGFGG